MGEVITSGQVKCYHCGDNCNGQGIVAHNKHFCCEGCKLVYEVLDENGLCTYYNLEENPGIKLKAPTKEKFAYLDDANVQQKLVQFQDENLTKITFAVPQMHCASCIWLLENLYKLRPGIQSSVANFIRKEVTITFNQHEITLRQVVELLASIGYEPSISMDGAAKAKKPLDRSFYYRLGVAGFCFGNIMLLSFPEYLSAGSFLEANYRQFFAYLNLLLALPVFFYSSYIYFKSAFDSLKVGRLNLDVPISIGILVLFSRSAFDILSHTGVGFMDSLAGLVFFLLIGRWFQGRTYERLAFERDYTSYFPVAVTKIFNKKETTVTLEQLQPNDIILVRNQELVPADAILLKGDGNINYSFVTGEAEPVVKTKGQVIFAGGRQEGSSIELQLVRKVSQSYLTGLWNHEAFQKDRKDLSTFANQISHYFTPVILTLATATLAFWLFVEPSKAVAAFTSVLIVACPCALALASPFTLGNAMRILGRNKLYLKDTSVVERLGNITSIVFDKTGTITREGEKTVNYSGKALSRDEQSVVASLVKHSNHPLSRLLHRNLGVYDDFEVMGFEEKPGKGLQGKVEGVVVMLGSAKYVNAPVVENLQQMETRVWVSIAGDVKGYFAFNNVYREGLKNMVDQLKTNHQISVISGDNEGEKERLANYLGSNTPMYFQQSPHNKLAYVEGLQQQGQKVMMLGDGLNDAGALRQSDAGIAISDDVNNFSPSCDAILDAKEFNKLPKFLAFSTDTRKVLVAGFVISAIYNIVGLYFAITGSLSPVIAALLMPISSVTVVVFGTVATQWLAAKHHLNKVDKVLDTSNIQTVNDKELKLT